LGVVNQSDIAIQVVQEPTKGLFGIGAKPAIVKAEKTAECLEKEAARAASRAAEARDAVANLKKQRLEIEHLLSSESPVGYHSLPVLTRELNALRQILEAGRHTMSLGEVDSIESYRLSISRYQKVIDDGATTLAARGERAEFRSSMAKVEQLLYMVRQNALERQ
jgi:hypothetical protein